MLVIKFNQTVHEILQELKDLSRFKGELKILVESLPENLESEIGLDHFVYMLSNYPRPIVWVSDNEHIFERLAQRALNVQRFNSYSSKTDKILEEIDRLSNFENQNSYQIQVEPPNLPSFNLESTFLNPNTSRRILNINPVFENNSKAIEPVNQLPAPIIETTNQIEHSYTKSIDFSNVKKSSPNLEIKISSPESSVPNSNNHEDLSIAESEYFDLDDDSDNNTPNKSPDIGKMRSKILASKEVLQSINHPNVAHKESVTTLIENQFDHIAGLENEKTSYQKSTVQNDAPSLSEIKSGFWNPLRYLYFLSFGLVAILSAVAIALGFPTVAYTIQVTPERQEKDALFIFEKNQINTQNFKFNLSAKSDTTGTISTTSTRARGKVRLLNKTSANIELTFSKFYISKGDNRYNPVYDSTQVQTINIPSKNNLSGPIVEIDIESGNVENGGNYDLKEGEELTPVNLQGVPFGPNFTAVVSQEVSSNTPQSNRTVTDGDLRTLRSTIESNLLKDKQSKIAEIDSKRYVSNVNWSTNIESVFNADRKVGDSADSVSLSATVSSDIYYLDKKNLVDQILSRESNADQVTKIEISNGETAWDKDAQKLTLEVKYIYTLKSDISEDKLKEIAQNSGLNTDDAVNKIKQTYPRVSDIKSSVSGVPVPINPHIEVDVVQGGILTE
jgi:hypothetical protein